MFKRSAKDIAEICSGTLVAGTEDRVASSCCVIKSFEAVEASIFAAFTGANADGHDYIEDAVSRGASIVLASKEELDYEGFAARASVILVDDVLEALQKLAQYQRSLMSCPVVGITGSSGKTSTKELLKGALDAAFSNTCAVLATEGNYNNELGVPLTILRANKDSEVVVVEMGMRGLGQITELAEIARPTMSIITTIGDAHIEVLGSRENIAKAKGEIFEALSEEQLAFMPAKVDFAEYLLSVSRAPVITVAVESHDKADDNAELSQQTASQTMAQTAAQEATYKASILNFDKEGCALSLVELPNAEKIEMKLLIPGEHSVQNALLALAAASALGVDAELAIRGMETVQPAEMRMQRRKAEALPQVEDVDILVDCYNANPESMAASLKTLAVSTLNSDDGKRIAVLGDMFEMGEHTERVHKDILLLAGLLRLDAVYTFGNAFKRATRDVLDELHMGKSLENFPELRSLTDMDLLLRSLSSEVTSGSLILVKGSRGMQMERVVEALVKEAPVKEKSVEKEGNS